MLALRSILLASLALGSGSHASPDVKWKRAASPVITVTNIHPTQSFVSPPDAACTVTYTTVVPGMATKPGGQATGLKPHTYTVSYECDCSPHAPCTLPSSPEICPPGLTVTTTVCDKCQGGPKTYTLTVPTQAAHTGEPSGGAAAHPEKPGHQSGGATPGQGQVEEGPGAPGATGSPGSKAPGKHTGAEGGHASLAPPGASASGAHSQPPASNDNTANNDDGKKAGDAKSGHGGNAGGGAKNGTETGHGPNVVATAGSWVLGPEMSKTLVLSIILAAVLTGVM